MHGARLIHLLFFSPCSLPLSPWKIATPHGKLDASCTAVLIFSRILFPVGEKGPLREGGGGRFGIKASVKLTMNNEGNSNNEK